MAALQQQLAAAHSAAAELQRQLDNSRGEAAALQARLEAAAAEARTSSAEAEALRAARAELQQELNETKTRLERAGAAAEDFQRRFLQVRRRGGGGAGGAGHPRRVPRSDSKQE